MSDSLEFARRILLQARNLLADAPTVTAPPKMISPYFGGGPWMTVDDEGIDTDAGEMFVPRPGFEIPEGGGGGWAKGVPQDTGPEDQAERTWREVKFHPGESRFYHPDTGEDVGEYEWGHFRPDRKMFVSYLDLLGYDIQSPAPGEPLTTIRGPKQPSLDPTNDPMGHLDKRPYNYGTMVDNLVSHYHGANDNERKQGRLWYRAAHDMFHKFAKDNDISPERAVAYGSAFSPLTDWGDNVHHAQQFMFGYRPGDPNFSPHDWQTAHISQGPLDTFRQQYGRDPSDTDEDLHALADLHQGQWPPSQMDVKKGRPGKHDIAGNPEARQRWMDNIKHKTMPAVLEDQARQAEAWRKSPKTSGPYNPAYSMRASGIKTLGGNIQKAKDLYHSPDDVAQMFKVLGGPKISHFTDNILDDTPIDSEGYYQHPVNPETGQPDWTLNKDLGGTIDSHHIRASSMPHGGWERKAYASKNPNTAHEYDVFNRGLLDATRKINDAEPDASKHITPKQLQAIVWLKHKNDKDYFERQRNPQTGKLINHESELGGAGRPEDWQYAEKSYKSKGKGLGKGRSRAAALDESDFADMPPLWRKMFMARKPAEWTDLLAAWVDHHTGSGPEAEFREPPHRPTARFVRAADQWGYFR